MGSLTLSTWETGAFPMGPVEGGKGSVGLAGMKVLGQGRDGHIAQIGWDRGNPSSHTQSLWESVHKTHLHRESNPQRRHIHDLSARGSAWGSTRLEEEPGNRHSRRGQHTHWHWIWWTCTLETLPILNAEVASGEALMSHGFNLHTPKHFTDWGHWGTSPFSSLKIFLWY